MKSIVESDVIIKAWASNVQHLVIAFADLLENAQYNLVSEQLIKNETIAVINGNFVPSFELDPYDAKSLVSKKKIW